MQPQSAYYGSANRPSDGFMATTSAVESQPPHMASKYGSGTMGGMSELSYSISENGTSGAAFQMSGSGFSHQFASNNGITRNPMLPSQTVQPKNQQKAERVDSCLDEFLSDVVGQSQGPGGNQ